MLQTSTIVRSDTTVLPFKSCLIVYCLLPFASRLLPRIGDSKSRIVSLYISRVDAYEIENLEVNQAKKMN